MNQSHCSNKVRASFINDFAPHNAKISQCLSPQQIDRTDPTSPSAPITPSIWTTPLAFHKLTARWQTFPPVPASATTAQGPFGWRRWLNQRTFDTLSPSRPIRFETGWRLRMKMAMKAFSKCHEICHKMLQFMTSPPFRSSPRRRASSWPLSWRSTCSPCSSWAFPVMTCTAFCVTALPFQKSRPWRIWCERYSRKRISRWRNRNIYWSGKFKFAIIIPPQLCLLSVFVLSQQLPLCQNAEVFLWFLLGSFLMVVLLYRICLLAFPL